MKKIKTIIRTGKIKTVQQLHNVGAHNNRLKDVPNASPKHGFKRFIGTSNLVQDVKHVLAKHGLFMNGLRKNAVICNELVLSLSPEYFDDGDLDFRNKFNKKNTLDFINNAKNFLIEKYGTKLAHLSVHLDESTPHIHAVVVPTYLDDASGRYKLAAKRLFDRSDLQLLQKEYCETFKSIKEYKFSYQEKSTAKHQDIKAFYKNIDETKRSLTSESKELKHQIQLLNDENKNLTQEVKSNFIENVSLTDELIIEREKVIKLERFINKTMVLLEKVAPLIIKKLRNVFIKKEDKFFNKYLDNIQDNKKVNKNNLSNKKFKPSPSNGRQKLTPNEL